MNNQPVGISDRFAGKVSHSQAMKKAKEEYRKYQKNTISPVEQADTFFKTVQNKLHYSVHGHTAAELIAERADNCYHVFGLCRRSGKTTYSNVYERQGREIKCFLTVYRKKCVNKSTNI